MSRVAIFDSGVGGLSIYQEVVKQCPHNDYIYISDNQAFPYGTKGQIELIERVTRVANRVNEHYAPDLLVVACNTASTVVLPTLRSEFDIDIIGVVPAIKPAAQLSITKHIGLLATPATIARSYTDELIEQFAANCRVTRVGSSELVEIAEDKLYCRTVDTLKIKTILQPVLDNTNIDTLVLACTHFPLLKNEIMQILVKHSRDIALIDSRDGIARRVAQLTKQQLTKQMNHAVEPIAAFTQVVNDTGFLSVIDQFGFNQMDLLTI